MSHLSAPAGVPGSPLPGGQPEGQEADCAGCGPSRRGVLRSAAAVGVVGAAGVGLAACSSGSSGSTASGPVTLGEASGVPVGSGTLYRSEKIVVTQPTAGAFKAFSAVCTHAGCVVDGVANGVIQCPCHGSQFNITTGAVVTGPASSPLPAKTVTVTDGKLVVSS